MITREALLAADYRPFTQKHLKTYTDKFYQKCIRDELGKLYFITLSEYDNREYKRRGSAPQNMPDFSYAPDAQFTIKDPETTFNVDLLHPISVESMEAFFEKMWSVFECEYYELYEGNE